MSCMHILEAVILGLIQGLTEFIPVSSSGHLVLADKLFNINVSSFTLDALLNVGTILALGIYLRADITNIAKGMYRRDPQYVRQGYYIIIATIPAVIMGLLLQGQINGFLRSLYVVATMLAFVGILMIFADRRDQSKTIQQLNWKSSLLIGIGQAFAVIPGVSRSGITILSARALSFDREASARFSFILALPILSAAVLKVTFTDGTRQFIVDNTSVFLVGNAVSFISGYIAVAFLIKYLKKHSLLPFVVYRLILASVIIFSFVIA
jgi:undecaprenyl-diphosphatase